jgi:hypothetical protein
MPPEPARPAAVKEPSMSRGDERTSVRDYASFPTSAPVQSPDRQADTSSHSPGTASLSNGVAGVSANGNGGAVQSVGRDLQRRWSDFLEFCSEKKGLVTMLQATQPPEPFGNTLRVYVPTDMELSHLNRSKEFLEERLQSFFKIPLTIEGALGAPPTRAANAAAPEPAATNGSAAVRIDHPFIRSLVELLEVNPI